MYYQPLPQAIRISIYSSLVFYTLLMIIIGYIGKGGLDLFPLVILIWCGLIIFFTSHVVVNFTYFLVISIFFIITDSYAGIFVEGIYPPNWLKRLILPWDFYNHQILLRLQLIIKSLICPFLRTILLCMLITRTIRWREYRRKVSILLFSAVAVLHLSWIDKIYSFTLLGHSPLIKVLPLDFNYLPPLFGFVWNTYRLRIAAAVAVTISTSLFIIARRIIKNAELEERLNSME